MVVGRGKGGLALYVGDGEGRWDGVKTLGVAGSASTNLYERTRPAAIDVNGDGLDDLVTGYADGSLDVRYVSVNKAFVFAYEALPFYTLEEALDTDEFAPELIWNTTAAAQWLAQSGAAPYGGDYAVSSEQQAESALETVVVGPGTLAFRWKKGGVGVYSVKTNGVEALACDAADWSEASVTVGSGFAKVSFAAASGAVGFLDRVEWTKDASASDDEKALQDEKAAYDDEFVRFMQTYGGVDPATAAARDYLVAMTNRTGKLGAGGAPLTLLDEFVAGTVPTDPDDVLCATIAIEDGTVYVGWVPDLNAGGVSRRAYRVYGKHLLSDEWSESPLDGAEIDGGYRFFKVTVEMPQP